MVPVPQKNKQNRGSQLKIYSVGGSVRDIIMNRPIHDRDFVVVGTTVEDMLARGFKPVGKEFPVFLHPETKEEYALARTERKVAPGYKGFVFHTDPSVTLEEDLIRRDLTMNAMAMDDDGNITDPFNGRQDIENKVLRHVSKAFREDPVRILRIARFSARYTDFTIAPETMDLMKDMVNNGEVDALVPERIWKELSLGLMEEKPSRMIEVLHDCGALARIFPEIEALWGVTQPENWHPEIYADRHTMLALDYSAKRGYPLPVRFGVLLHDLGKGTTPKDQLPHHRAHEERGAVIVEKLCRRLHISNFYRETAVMIAREHGMIRRSIELPSKMSVMVLERCDAFRRPERFNYVIDATECDLRGRGYGEKSTENIPYPQRKYWQTILDAVAKVNAGAIVQSLGEDAYDIDIPRLLHDARADAASDAIIEMKFGKVKKVMAPPTESGAPVSER